MSGHRLCAHAGAGDATPAHWLQAGERCTAAGPDEAAFRHEVGERLHYQRDAARWTQAKLGQLAGVSNQTVSNLELGRLTIEQKAAKARELQALYRWPQRKLAEVFGVSQPAVSQWLSRTADRDGEPVYVTGQDGKTYDATPAARPEEKTPRSPWLPDGHGYKALAKATRVLQSEPLGGLSPLHLARLGERLSDLIEAAESMQNEVQEAS